MVILSPPHHPPRIGRDYDDRNGHLLGVALDQVFRKNMTRLELALDFRVHSRHEASGCDFHRCGDGGMMPLVDGGGGMLEITDRGVGRAG